MESSDNTSISCENCKAETLENNKFCTHCGFPAQGTEEEKRSFHLKISSRQRLLNDAKGKIKQAKTIIIVIGMINLILGVLLGVYEDDMATIVASIILGIIYIILAIWCDKNPYGAILTAFVLYITIILISFIVDPSTLIHGIIFKALFIVAFIKGLKSASEAKRLMSELHAHKVHVQL